MTSKPGKKEALAIIAELFREYGYHGTSYGQITKATGLGKGSLYHYFPKGKEDIVKAILHTIHEWFEDHIFRPLEEPADDAALESMFAEVASYFHSGRRVCLLGAFALTDTRTIFSEEIAHYFARWIAALETYLQKRGVSPEQSSALATATIISIQGGLLMAHAFDKPEIFVQSLEDSHGRLTDALKQG